MRFVFLAILTTLLAGCTFVETGTIHLSISADKKRLIIEPDVVMVDGGGLTLGQLESLDTTIKSFEKIGAKYKGNLRFSYNGKEEQNLNDVNWPSKDSKAFAAILKKNELAICVGKLAKSDLEQIKAYKVELDFKIDTSGIAYEIIEGKDVDLNVEMKESLGKCKVFDLSKEKKFLSIVPVNSSRFIFISIGILSLILGSFFVLRKKFSKEPSTSEEDVSDTHEEVHIKITSKKQPEDDQELSNNESENAEDDKKKKLKSMLIRAVVIVVLGYMAIDQFILRNDSENEIVSVPTMPRKKRVKPPSIENKMSEIKKTDTTHDEKAEEITIVLPVEKVVDILDLKSNKKDVVNPDVKTELIPEDIVDTKTEINDVEISASNENFKITDKKREEVVSSVNSTQVAGKSIAEVNSVEVKKQIVPNPIIAEVKPADKNKNVFPESVGSIEKIEKKSKDDSLKIETKLEDKIIADDLYTAPPDYDLLGRGLVYNCKDKHWACVDKPSYVSCSKNIKWNKIHEQAAECAILHVYLSNEDCATVQGHNVSTNQPTPFCQ